MKVLITGSSGFLGASIVEALLAEGHSVVGLDQNSPHHHFERINADLESGRYVSLIGDSSDPSTLSDVLSEYRATHIVHAAAITPSPVVERAESIRIVQTNELSTLHLLLLAAEHHVQRFLFLSSAAVYGDAGSQKSIPEVFPLRTQGGLYALTKLASERLCAWAQVNLEIDVRVARYGPVYGPHELPTGSRQAMSPAYRAVHLALAGETITCNDKLATQDWIYAYDAGDAAVALLKSQTLNHSTYNVAGPPVTMQDLFQHVAAAVPSTTVQWIDDQSEAKVAVHSRSRRTPLDTTRLRSDTTYQPRYSIEAGIADYIRWIRDRMVKEPLT